VAATVTTFNPRSTERLVRGRNFVLTDISAPTTPLVLGLVKAFELQYGAEVNRFITIDGDQGIVERPPIGNLTISRIASFAGLPRLVCDCVLKRLQFSAGASSCSDSVDTTYILKNAKVTSIAVSGNADDWIVNYNMIVTFTDMA